MGVFSYILNFQFLSVFDSPKPCGSFWMKDTAGAGSGKSALEQGRDVMFNAVASDKNLVRLTGIVQALNLLLG